MMAIRMNRHGNVISFFLGVVFLLFPIAHFKIDIWGLPLYWAEIPILLVACAIGWKVGICSPLWQEMWAENKVAIVGTGLFLLGAGLSYVLNATTLTGLGMLKSFFLLPVLLAFCTALTVHSIAEVRMILWLWLAGIITAAWTSLVLAGEGILTYDGRLISLYESPNYLAMLLAPGFPLSAYFFLTSDKLLFKIGTGFFFVVIGSALWLTQSYGALIGVVLAMSVFLFLARRELGISGTNIAIASVLLVVLGGVVLLPTEKFQALVQFDERSSLASRLMIWEAGVSIARDSLPFGIGPGNFQARYLEYQKFFPPYLEWAVPQPHNLYLALLLQAGIVGLVGFFLVVVTVAKKMLVAWSQQNLPKSEALLGVILLALLVLPLLMGLVDTPYFKNDLAFTVWGTIGLLMAWAHFSVNGSREQPNEK